MIGGGFISGAADSPKDVNDHDITNETVLRLKFSLFTIPSIASVVTFSRGYSSGFSEILYRADGVDGPQEMERS